MILSEKGIEAMFPPPPPYDAIASNWRPPAPQTPPIQTRGVIQPTPRKHVETSSESFNGHLCDLPAHIILQIAYSTFPQKGGMHVGEGKVELQRANLFWLENSLRLVNRIFYTTCMHILRSTYIPAYSSLIRAPYSSDPFFSPYPPTSKSGSLPSRELVILDQFIALLAHEDVLLDSSSLYLPREEAYKDLFDLVQPKSRLEDLVHYEGLHAGVILSTEPDMDFNTSRRASTSNGHCEPPPTPTSHGDLLSVSPTTSAPSSPLPSPSPTRSTFKKPFAFVSSFREKHIKKHTPPPPPTPFITEKQTHFKPIPFSRLSISFSPRILKLMYSDEAGVPSDYGLGSEFGSLSLSNSARKKRTLVEIGRTRDESLEVSARRLVEALREVLEEDPTL